MIIKILTSAPEFYSNIKDLPILGRSLKNSIWSLEIVDIRNYGIGKHKKIDDYSYGGGGMIMKPDVISDCIEDNIEIKNLINNPSKLFICTSPRGSIFNQNYAREIASKVKELYILCNRFEGIDQRVIEYYNIKEVSIGDYILMGGEIASMAIIEAVTRLIRNVISKEESLEEESFSNKYEDLLEYDHFTKPRSWNNLEVPTILTSGNHKQIEMWRKENSEKKTQDRKNKESEIL